jgi:hypothetical protein
MGCSASFLAGLFFCQGDLSLYPASDFPLVIEEAPAFTVPFLAGVFFAGACLAGAFLAAGFFFAAVDFFLLAAGFFFAAAFALAAISLPSSVAFTSG